MKRIFLLISMAACVLSCSKIEKDEFLLTGTVKGADGKNIILERQDEIRGLVAVDTAKIEEGKFSFKGKITEPFIYSLIIEGSPNKSYVILENAEVNIEINKDSVFLNKMSGTYHNDELTKFNAIGLKYQKQLREYESVNSQAMIAAQQNKDTAVINKLRKGYGNIQGEMEKASLKYVEENPKSFVSLLLLQGFFRSPNADMQQIKSLYGNLSADLKKTKIGTEIKKMLDQASTVDVGRQAPNFTANDPSGKPVSLAQSLGKATLIDFWASWCGPCRAENPNVVALYNEFHDKGLNIIGVSLDKEGETNKWTEAIAKDQLVWTQVSNLKYWDDPIAEMYGVKSIPATFLLDQRGVVVAKDLRGKALRDKVAEMLK